MTDATYHLPTLGGLMSHWPGRLSLVRDAAVDDDIEAEELEWHARASSGDYFMALATELDKVAQSIARGSDAEAAQLERLVAELLFLQRNYELTKK